MKSGKIKMYIFVQINDKENEERIKKADQEKYDLNRKCVSTTLQEIVPHQP